MCQMNVLEAKRNFSKIIAMLEYRDEKEVIVAKAGKPVVKIVLYTQQKTFDQIFGIAKGKFKVPDNIDECNDEIARMFGITE